MVESKPPRLVLNVRFVYANSLQRCLFLRHFDSGVYSSVILTVGLVRYNLQWVREKGNRACGLRSWSTRGHWKPTSVGRLASKLPSFVTNDWFSHLRSFKQFAKTFVNLSSYKSSNKSLTSNPHYSLKPIFKNEMLVCGVSDRLAISLAWATDIVRDNLPNVILSIIAGR